MDKRKAVEGLWSRTTLVTSSKDKTNVQITTETRDRLRGLGAMNDSYEDVIKRVLDEREVALDYDPFFVSKPQ